MDEESGATVVPPVATWPIVTLPAEIDITNAAHVEDELRASFVPGVAMVIADMTQAEFCDSSGIRCLVSAHDLAAAAGAELRIAIHSDAVLRIFRLVGVDQLLNIFPSMDAASADASVADRSPDEKTSSALEVFPSVEAASSDASVAGRSTDEGTSSALAARAPFYRRLVIRSRR